jgi:hypothetical protein
MIGFDEGTGGAHLKLKVGGSEVAGWTSGQVTNIEYQPVDTRTGIDQIIVAECYRLNSFFG